MTSTLEEKHLIDRREAIRRVSALLGGAAFIGGTTLIAACEKRGAATADTAKAATAFTPEEVAYLDEIAETILPETKTPGAKAAKTGAFMALMVTDTYEPKDQQTFRAGMKTLDDESKKLNKVGFMQATPAQRLALLEKLDKEAKDYMDAREKAGATAKSAQAARPIEQAPQGEAKGGAKDTAQQAATGSTNPATAITADAPPHYFRMMKELTLLGYFTSEIGYTKAMRYQETPGRFDPCLPYQKGEVSWASHA